MQFSVIYDIEVTKGSNISMFRPHRHDLWELTEYNCDISRLTDDDTTKQRKWCALLTRKQFEAWLERVPCYFHADSIETCGSLGASGFGMEWSPAIAFVAPDLWHDAPHALCCGAYVTPIPEVYNWPDDKQFDERNWQRIRDAVIRCYSIQ